MDEHEIKLRHGYTVKVDSNENVVVCRNGQNHVAQSTLSIALALEVVALREQLAAYKRYDRGKK